MNATIELYDSTGAVKLYTFPLVQDTNLHEGAGRKSISHSTPRGKGSIVIDGGEEAREIFIEGIIYGAGYDEVIDEIETMKSAIVQNTPYVLKMRKTSTTKYEENVKRIQPISFPVDSVTMMTKYQSYRIVFLGNSW